MKPTKRRGAAYVPAKPAEERMAIDEAAALILRAGLGMTARQLIELTGRTGTFVLAVRVGKACADVLPELPRYTVEELRRSCRMCVHWDEEAVHPCKLGIPEVERPVHSDGKLGKASSSFGRECAAFTPLEPER